jgi:plasmid stabilization system protein ParE
MPTNRKYTFVFTELYNDDIEEARHYFRIEKKEPKIGANLMKLIVRKINILETMPYSRPLVLNTYLATRGFRTVLVKNYILFYFVDEANRTVVLARFIHGSRDWANIIKEDLEDE